VSVHPTGVTTLGARTLLLSRALGLITGRGLSCAGGVPD